MAVTQTAIVEGVVARVSSRTITSNKGPDGPKQFTFVNFLLIGQNTLAEVRVPDGQSPPAQDAKVRARVSLGAYNGSAECTLDAYL